MDGCKVLKTRCLRAWAMCLMLCVLVNGFVFDQPTYALESKFKDVTGSEWYAGSLETVTGRKIIAGFPDGTFGPGKPVTVEQFLVMVVAAMGKTPTTKSEKGWAWPSVEYATQHAWVDETWFKSQADYQRPITRMEMGYVLGQVLRRGTTIPGTVYRLGALIKDWPSIQTKYGKSAYGILVSYANGLLSGYPDGTFGADRQMTRAEAAVVLERLVQPEKRAITDLIQKALAEDKVVVEGIPFDYEKDTFEYAWDYSGRNMRDQASLSFFKLLLDRLRFYRASDGKLYVKGNLPKLPYGFRWQFTLRIWYKEAFAEKHGIIQEIDSWWSESDKIYPPETIIPEVGDFKRVLRTSLVNDVDHVEIQAGIHHALAGGSSVDLSFVLPTENPLRVYGMTDLYAIPYDWKAMFEW